jgi:hypothetical protein
VCLIGAGLQHPDGGFKQYGTRVDACNEQHMGKTKSPWVYVDTSEGASQQQGPWTHSSRTGRTGGCSHVPQCMYTCVCALAQI